MNKNKWNWNWVKGFAIVIVITNGLFWCYELIGQFSAMTGDNTKPTLSEILVTLVPQPILVSATIILGLSITSFLVWHWIDLKGKIQVASISPDYTYIFAVISAILFSVILTLRLIK